MVHVCLAYINPVVLNNNNILTGTRENDGIQSSTLSLLYMCSTTKHHCTCLNVIYSFCPL